VPEPGRGRLWVDARILAGDPGAGGVCAIVIRAFAICAAVAFALWGAGFLWFIERIPAADLSVAPTDAIVVLTGGSERLHEGLELLQEGKGRKLFVSGVNPEVGLSQLLRASGKTPVSKCCWIVLGHKAASTLENAAETAAWMRKEGYGSLRLVTSWYHMPRSLLDFARAMPKMTIVAHPVFPAQNAGGRWWAHESALRLLAREYSKYLVALGEAPLPQSAGSENAARLRASGGAARAGGAP
jgi:uncharacterized SAM-binding protein YcdF (DUF218 family)